MLPAHDAEVFAQQLSSGEPAGLGRPPTAMSSLTLFWGGNKPAHLLTRVVVAWGWGLLVLGGLRPRVQRRRRLGEPLLRLFQRLGGVGVREHPPVGLLGLLASDLLEGGLEVCHAVERGGRGEGVAALALRSRTRLGLRWESVDGLKAVIGHGQLGQNLRARFGCPGLLAMANL